MSSLPPDPYKILGVSKDAQVAEIRSAHRKLVLKCHPDKVQDPALKAQKQDEFQKVQQAYEILSDDKERQKYDDQVKLAELRRQMQNRANTTAPRSSPKYTEYEIRTPEPRSSSYKSAASSPTTNTRAYSAYSKSWDEDSSRGPRIFEAEIRSRREREGSYSEKPSKRDGERERERERDRDREREREKDREYRESREKERDRERERERERERDRELRERDKERERELRDRERRKAAKAEEAARRAEKEAKEARRAEKKRQEKLRDREIKRESEEKKKHTKPYIETPYDDDIHVSSSRSEKKKSSSSKKHDEKRERSLHREEVLPDPLQAGPVPAVPSLQSYDESLDFATAYIQAAREKVAPLQRSATYHVRSKPPAPTPPPMAGQTSAFAVPTDDEDVRRSSARARRGSSDTVGSSRSKSHKKASRETLGDHPVVVDASPLSRHAPAFPKSATTTPVMSSSPPRQELPRTSTMPVESSYTRPAPSLSRSATFSSYGEGVAPRGRSRSRLQPQIEESEDDYEPRPKHRSSKKHRSPTHQESVRRYHVDNGRTKSYSHQMEAEPESYSYYATPGVRVVETSSRPSMSRETSYSAKPYKVKYSKAYGQDDVQQSSYYASDYRGDNYPPQGIYT